MKPCAACAAALDPQEYARCDVCAGAMLCLACARSHLCTSECANRDCVQGLCVRVVRRGRLADRFGVP